MARFSGWGFLAAVSIHAVSRLAHAGCPSVCDVALTAPVITPALDCLQVTASESGCDCAVDLSFKSSCDFDAAALGFTFTSCTSDEPTGISVACPVLSPSETARLEVSLEGDGKREVVSDVQHRISLTATVRNYDGSPGGCSLAARRAQHAWSAIGASVVLALLRRRRRR